MFAAERYSEMPSQFGPMSTSTAVNSPVWLHVDVTHFANAAGRLQLLTDLASTTNPPPSLDVGNGLSIKFPACVYTVGAAAIAGSVAFLARGLPPIDRGTSFDVDLTYARLAGAAPLVFNVELAVPDGSGSSSLSQIKFYGSVVFEPAGSRQLESSRVTWSNCNAQAIQTEGEGLSLSPRSWCLQTARCSQGRSPSS